MSLRDPALEISGIDYYYRHQWTGKLVQVLFDLNLTVRSGECFGFLGHNGAGKTTAIKCILDLIHPRRGAIKLFGTDHRIPQARALLGYLPEQPYFYDHLSVTEILALYGQLNDLRGAELREAIRSAIALVGLDAKAAVPMRTLSKGLTQRLALAQAVLAHPKLLILDEPFSGLDPIGRKEFRDILLKLKQEGTTIFMSSHILSDVEFLCDRASIMVNGKIKGIYDLRNAPELSGGRYELIVRAQTISAEALDRLAVDGRVEHLEKFVRISYDSRGRADLAMKEAIELGTTIDSFQFVHASLEDIFVQLVKLEEEKGR